MNLPPDRVVKTVYANEVGDTEASFTPGRRANPQILIEGSWLSWYSTVRHAEFKRG